MNLTQRILWAFAIVLFDMVIFVIPVFAFFAAYVIVRRPPWFREWVLKLYSE